jgi:hypothetical protein
MQITAADDSLLMTNQLPAELVLLESSAV